MIVQKEFLNKIGSLGLNSYEAKLWAALLSRGISTAGELSDIANVPRSRSYDVLESLEKKGFVIMKVGKPIKYIAVNPNDVLERVKKNVIQEAETSAQSLDKLKESEMIKELNLLHSKGITTVEPTELSGAFKGRSNLYSHIDSMMKTAENSIIISTTEEGLIRKADSFRKTLYKAKDSGVDVKILAPITEINRQAASRLSEYAEIKSVEKALGRFVVIDDSQITFMLSDDKNTHPSYDSGVWINSPFFTGTLSQMFRLAWSSADKVRF